MSWDDPVDRALRAAATSAPPASPEEAAVDEGLLLAYRRGELSEDRAREVEALLERNASARALLVELSKPVDQELADRLAALPAGRARRSQSLWVGGFVAAAAAAIAAIVFFPFARAWPVYELEVDGFVAPLRGSEKSALLEPDSRLVVRLRPEHSIEEQPAFGVWIVSASGVLEPVRAGALDSGGGAFRWVAEARSLFTAPGHYLLVVHLAADRDQLLRASGRTLEEARRDQPAIGWWTVPIEYVISAP